MSTVYSLGDFYGYLKLLNQLMMYIGAMRRLLASLLTTSLISISPAHAQMLPPGTDIQSMVGGPHPVPAGQTTTIDLGVPVNAFYSGNGWNISSSGTSVTVTAPASGSVNVPVSSHGYNATVTLVAEGGAEVPSLDAVVPSNLNPVPIEPDAPGTPGAPGSSAPGAGKPSGPSEPDRGGAEQIHLDATISDNTIVSKLTMSQAVNLYNRFGGASSEEVKLRYLDINGKEIKGVKREIDKGSRTLTLTYPEGATPNNPFIIEVVKDGASIAVVTLTDPNVSAAQPTDPAKSPSQPSTISVDSSPTKKYGIYAVGGLVVLLLVVGLVTALIRKRS